MAKSLIDAESLIAMFENATAEQGAVDGVLVHEGSEVQRHPEGVLLDRSVSDDVEALKHAAHRPASHALAHIRSDDAA